MNKPLKIKNAPPRKPGEITIGSSTNGLVIILSDGAQIVFTPDQARFVARELYEKADDAERQLRSN